MSVFDWLCDQDDKTERLLILYSLLLIVVSFSGEWLRWLPTTHTITSILLPEYTATKVSDIGSPHVFQLKSIDFIFEPLPSKVMGVNGGPSSKTSVLQSITTNREGREGQRDEDIYASDTEFLLDWIKQVGGFFLVLWTIPIPLTLLVPKKDRSITDSKLLSFLVRLGAIAWTLYFLIAVFSPQTLWIDNASDEPRVVRINNGNKIELQAKSSTQLAIMLPWPKTVEIFDKNQKLIESARVISLPHYVFRIFVYNIESMNTYHIETGKYRAKY